MQIIDLTIDDKKSIQKVAGLLMAGFTEAWNDIEEALSEVEESLPKDRISRIAVEKDGTVVGWIAGQSNYRGNVWELHPLVVDESCRGKGIGRALVADFEACVKSRGGITIYLGTDDETNSTSLYGKDLYPDVLGKVMNMTNRNRHPYGFYKKLGYEVVGVLPDANGFGKPDIFMAKRVQASEESL
ncbi:GNAT family N-acetyltransferase [Paenibacillus sp. UNC451MF]|uniref:GNAT family N-acetyltransferase n=1 Tax=Paenibacillus sp. UNC451MF TaxID=1449063 RepID=UPI000490CFFF|nr:GNAT family N-acetyltransferase [Paenibacillus sp. UNC451MF]